MNKPAITNPRGAVSADDSGVLADLRQLIHSARHRVATDANAEQTLNEPIVAALLRFTAGLKNFHDIYQNVVDAWILYDNSGNVPKVIERGENNE